MDVGQMYIFNTFWQNKIQPNNYRRIESIVHNDVMNV